jgi:hypothetical protein
MILHNHRRLPVSIFNLRFRVFEAGYWKNFKNQSTFKGEAQTLSMLFSTTKKQKNGQNYQRMYIK